MKKAQVNPFLENRWMPNYAAMTPELCDAALTEALPKAERAFKFVEKTLVVSWKGLMVDPNEAVREPFDVWGILSHLTSVVNSEAWRKVEEKWQPAIVTFSLQVAQSKPLYEGMLALQADETLLPWQKHVLERAILSMQNNGVGLTGAAKKKFNSLQAQLAKLSMQFSNNVLDSEKAAKVEIQPGEEDGIPADLLQGKGPWTLGIDFSTFDSVMRYAKNPEVREKFWRLRCTRASAGKVNNAPLIEKILKLRQQMADLLGYVDYAHLSTAAKMAGTPAKVFELLDPMAVVGKPAAKAEDDNLAAFAKKNGFKGKLQPWDKPFWIERQSNELFGYDEEAMREYFPMEHVLDGLFALVEQRFGVTFERAKGAIHAWHKDVRFYKVFSDKKCVAGFYFDPYARPGTKNGGAWMNEIHHRDFVSRKQLPVAVVVCNQKAPKGKQPATMSLYEVSTLFHEMGHALQQMLTIVDDSSCAGINNVEWDAVEIASQFLEQFPTDPTLLRSLSCHIKTGKKIPTDLANRIASKRTYRAGNALVRQLLFAETDLTLHSKTYPKRFKNANACKETFAKRLTGKAMHADDRFLNAFTHIFAGGYAAGYYSYKWSETLSADIYGALLDAPSAKRTAFCRKYRDTVLALGGSAPAAEVFRKLMGRDPDVTAILKQEGLLPNA